MKRFFFIAGLPRSRTAWLANLLSWGSSFCHHEAFRRCGKQVKDGVCPVKEYVQLLENTQFANVGDSSSSNALVCHNLFPESKWVLIERDLTQAHKSWEAAFPEFKSNLKMLLHIKSRNDLLKSNLGRRLLVVQYDDIDKRIIEIMDHVGVYVPRERVNQALEFTVTLNLPKALGRWNKWWIPDKDGNLDPEYVKALLDVSEYLRTS